DNSKYDSWEHGTTHTKRRSKRFRGEAGKWNILERVSEDEAFEKYLKLRKTASFRDIKSGVDRE
ncbi:hypothetical protein HAX54_000970, partial [Datura stramonium]|nr:hypothetical protein [Datura stramonium]